jgi:HTH-type transcriptional regulator/antitoxin HigA
VTLVEAWEAKHYPLDLPDALEAIKHHMDWQASPRAISPPSSATRNRLYEVPFRKRPPPLAMVRGLREGLGIPAESLIKAGRDRTA